MRKSLIAILSIALLILTATPSQALHTLDKYINAKSLAAPGLLIINPNDGKVIAENAPESLRVPASVLKLISTSAALHFVGPEKTYTTRIFSTDKSTTFVLRGSLDPWLTSNLTLSKKNGQKYLPGLVTKANTKNKKTLTIYYSGLFEKDTKDLGLNFRKKGIRITFKKVDSDRKSTRLNSSHVSESRMPSSA